MGHVHWRGSHCGKKYKLPCFSTICLIFQPFLHNKKLNTILKYFPMFWHKFLKKKNDRPLEARSRRRQKTFPWQRSIIVQIFQTCDEVLFHKNSSSTVIYKIKENQEKATKIHVYAISITLILMSFSFSIWIPSSTLPFHLHLAHTLESKINDFSLNSFSIPLKVPWKERKKVKRHLLKLHSLLFDSSSKAWCREFY